MAVTTKTSRIDIRLSEDDKNMIEQAAAFNRQSTTSYIISVVVKQAQLDLKRSELLNLSKEDFEYLLDLLKNPREPNERLKALFK